jgi:homoserine dehydrogenase
VGFLPPAKLSQILKDFEAFQSGYAANGQHYMLGRVSLKKLAEWSAWENVGIILSPEAAFVAETQKREEVQYSAA